MRRQGFERAKHRFFGSIKPVLIDSWDHEIDTEFDLWLARTVSNASKQEPPLAVAGLRCLVVDFDGVLTDNHVFVAQDGTETVRCSRADGLGAERLRTAGVRLLILSSESNPVVAMRAAKLNIQVEHGVSDKGTFLLAWLAKHSIDPTHTGYIGNDTNDLACLAAVGWPIVVADATPAAKRCARTVLSRCGGMGVLQEVADILGSKSKDAINALNCSATDKQL